MKRFVYLLMGVVMIFSATREIFAQQKPIKNEQTIKATRFDNERLSGKAYNFVTIKNESRLKNFKIYSLNKAETGALLQSKMWAVPVVTSSGYEFDQNVKEIKVPCSVITFTRDKKSGKETTIYSVKAISFKVVTPDGLSVIVSGDLPGMTGITNTTGPGHNLEFIINDTVLGLADFSKITMKSKVAYPMFIEFEGNKFLIPGDENSENIMASSTKEKELLSLQKPEVGTYFANFEVYISDFGGWTEIWNQDGTRKQIKVSVDENGEISPVIPNDLLGVIAVNYSFTTKGTKPVFLRTNYQNGVEFFWGSGLSDLTKDNSLKFKSRLQRTLNPSQRYTAFSLPVGKVHFLYRHIQAVNQNRLYLGEIGVDQRGKNKFTLWSGKGILFSGND